MAKKDVDIDVLVRVLQDEECRDKLYEALRDKLNESPLTFYQDFIIPRSGKMKEILGEGILARMTITQEVALMNKATSPPKEENTQDAAKD